MLIKLTILPDNRQLYVEKGSNLLNVLQSNGYNINSPCGGMGICGKCGIRIGTLSSERGFIFEEDNGEKSHLACRVSIEDDTIIELPPSINNVPLKETIKSNFLTQLSPGLKKFFFSLPLASSHDQRSYSQRIQDSFGEKLSFSLEVLRKIPLIVRDNDFKATITVDERDGVIDLEGGDKRGEFYGIGIDIGTTTVVIYCFNLITGKEIAAKSITNPQTIYGADVISRIHYVNRNGNSGLKELQEKILTGLNSLLDKICCNINISRKNIYKATIAGNPTMIHLLLAIDPSYIGRSPYISVLRDIISLKSKELGLNIHPEGTVYILPGVSAYVGGDITGGILATGIDKSKTLKLLIDIGTNGEIVLGYKNKILACSTAAGPAFEGTNIEKGMRAQEGAIYKIEPNKGDIILKTFGDGTPSGICGSGLIDFVASLRKLNLISENGRLIKDSSIPGGLRISTIREREVSFNLYDDIYVSQKDIREVQLAKGAIRAGIEILLKEFGVTTKDIKEVYLAGAFGSFLRKESVKAIGLIPPVKLSKIKSVGNSAGAGVKLCLLNQSELKHIQKIAERVDYLELSYRADFNDEFIKQMKFS
ncbi:MAG TPA: ASKHA domain-containing protein [Candidatus Eremiobacteraeota bacterium]|nr:MAG: Na(+)-translocating NADH-quinone reductase subunit F [bacterium ADurb.Bin363]HPZ09454.1 ASKHA domain-containing protein [Candidatus Eremiobacteraeota bacterium]